MRLAGVALRCACNDHDIGHPGGLAAPDVDGINRLGRRQVGHLLGEIARRGVSILLVEQKLTVAMRISRRLYVMGHGRIVFEGTPADIEVNADVRKEWLEV